MGALVPGESVSSLLPYGGLLLALFVLLWLVDKFTGGIVEELGKRVLDRFQSGRERNLLKRRALRMYITAVRQNYGTHTMGFRRDDAPIAVEDVYIPVRYESDGERLDAEERLRNADRAVVVGEPGAGKSMLLKHLMLEWTRNTRRDPSTRVPVLVDLHLYGTGGATLKDLLARALSHGKWQFTPKQLDAALGEGRLRLYFDGLDEVLRDRYPEALAELKDLAQRHHACPMVVTCRNEVYDGELAAEFGPPLTVADLDDAALRLLLRHLLNNDEQLESLFGALQANRPVLSLARSPMLLTMIAYLYLEGVFGERAERMPRSRSEFYDKTVAYLLRRDEARGLDQITRHGPAIKLAILRKLALLLMSRQDAGDGDRRAITHRDLLAVIRAESEDFNLDRAEAGEVIREIVERSRLLIRLEGAEELYGFRHLTLQEYLAALELGTNWEELLQHYQRHPETWREVVLLWSGMVADDSTPLLRAIYTGEDDEGRVLVVRCLAEATRVESAFANEVIAHFLGQLASGAVLADATVRALGTLVGVGGPRGQGVLDTLLRIVDQAPDVIGEPRVANQARPQVNIADEPRRQAIRVLAASGHPEAGALLTRLALSDPFARAVLRSMGELAIPALRTAAEQDQGWAIEDIGLIGTPAAAEALVPLLAPDSPVSEFRRLQAAWWLAALLNSDDVRAVLNKERRDEVVPGERLDWVTKPYRREWLPRLSSVVGRVARLLVQDLNEYRPESAPPDSLPPVTPLIALPSHAALLGHRDGQESMWAADEDTQQQMDELRQLGVSALAHGHSSAEECCAMLESVGLAALSGTLEPRVRTAAEALAQRVVEKVFPDSPQLLLIRALDWRIRVLLVASFGARHCSRQDWEALAERTPEPRVLRLIRNSVLVLLATWVGGLGAVRVGGAITGSWALGPAPAAWIVGAATVGVIVGFVGLVLEATSMGPSADSLFYVISGGMAVLGGVIVAVALPIYGVFTTVEWLASSIGVWGGWAVILASAVVAFLLGVAVSSRTRRFQNPFQNILRKCAPHLLPAPEQNA
ncbi:NACHT domain-containing protein [Acrocarpospora catenulata]|uniref:NACHT domain-containing protein n=1 Tax=Acrocarpospora catenulata TaxID=2836182 RepID=UPI001BDA1B40|nr:NACHT domain-containing protein [Acrocarpospora catenulata]